MIASLVCALLSATGEAFAQPSDDSPGFWGQLRETTPAGASETIDETPGFWRQTGTGIKTIWTTGGTDIFVPGYIWHMPWHYSDEQLERYNTLAWGLGYGRTLRSRSSRPRTLYGIVSADSYNRPEYMVGYAWRAQWRPGGGAFSLGGGYTALLIGRYDKLRYTPLPIVIPLVSIGVDRFEMMSVYVPGFEVGYFFLKLNLGRSSGSSH